jgi:hypothetical protein
LQLAGYSLAGRQAHGVAAQKVLAKREISVVGVVAIDDGHVLELTGQQWIDRFAHTRTQAIIDRQQIAPVDDEFLG